MTKGFKNTDLHYLNSLILIIVMSKIFKYEYVFILFILIIIEKETKK